MAKMSAEYMRAYRARRKDEMERVLGAAPVIMAPAADLLNERILELEAEVAHLNSRLALHHPVTRGELTNAANDKWVPEFRPAPKSGKRK